MINSKFLLLVLSGLLLAATHVGCSAGGGNARSLAASVYYPTTLSGNNVLPMSVGACGVHGYENEPCISVTVCTPGTSTCQTIDNILVDTGSYGLKIFKSLVSVSLPEVDANDGGKLASCTSYLDGSGHWGPVVRAKIKMGGLETTQSVPMVLLDKSYGNYSVCSTKPDVDPEDAGFNGIIGVGAFVEDCSVSTTGSNPCTTQKTSAYWSCSGTVCRNSVGMTDVTVPTTDQIANPVAYMPSPYNNGLILKLPSVPVSGAGAAYGYLIMGIGVSGDANTSASSATAFGISNDGYFRTVYNGNTINKAFIDSGTNFYGFPQYGGAPPLCAGSNDFYCPSSQLSLTGTMYGMNALGTTPNGGVKSVPFYVGNMVTLASADPQAMVYNNIGFTLSGMFDWGLPFFLGRTVFVGIKGQSASVGGNTVSGPFWAF